MTTVAKVTPRDFFLWLGAMVAFYISIFSFIALFFQYVDIAFPDPAQGYFVGDPYSSGIRWSIASLIVLFPLYLLLMRLIRNIIAGDATKKEIWVRRWILVFTIFIAGFTIAIDLVSLINSFLGGDLTTPFFLKVAIVLLVASAGLMHFIADLWGFWDEKRLQGRAVAYAASLAVVSVILAGFFIIGSPTQLRLYRLDDQKISDLQNLQSQIVNYWQQKSTLPKSLADLQDPVSGFIVPIDTQSDTAYEYSPVASTTFQLCANFNADMQSTSQYYGRGPAGIIVAQPAPPSKTSPIVPTATGEDLYASSWWHGVGHACFKRTIDPERYPPLSSLKKTI